jgi:cyclophilin family peptidyl-prolyl cis-trans isomerase
MNNYYKHMNKKIQKSPVHSFLHTDFGKLVTIALLTVIAVSSLLLLSWRLSEDYREDYFKSQKDIAHISEAHILTTFGEIVFEFNDNVPQSKRNFISLATRDFYDGIRIHRVVKGLGIQTGDPSTWNNTIIGSWGSGGPGYSLPKETHEEDEIVRGSVILADVGSDSHGSQFMIITNDTPWLNAHNTILGHVTSGMDVVDTIENIPTGLTGIPTEDVIVISVTLSPLHPFTPSRFQDCRL